MFNCFRSRSVDNLTDGVANLYGSDTANKFNSTLKRARCEPCISKPIRGSMFYADSTDQKEDRIKHIKLMLEDHVITPMKMCEGDAAYDLYYCGIDFDIEPHDTVVSGLGIRAVIPDGYYIQFYDRSSLATAGVTLVGGGD